MKKFIFPLDTVLSYRSQILDNVRNEHAQILSKVIKKEQQVAELKQQVTIRGREFDQCKREGATIMKMRTYESYLHLLRGEITLEKENLKLLKEQEEAKRAEVIEAKKDARTIEKLKENKKIQYDRDVQKKEEQLIEEFVSNKRSVMS